MAADTRDRILKVALDLFNEQGLHAVGVREIARALGISVGNLAYHFPQKDALVRALVEELHQANSARLLASPEGPFSFEAFYRGVLEAMRNQYRYRFWLYSYVEVLRTSPDLLAEDRSRAAARRERIARNIGRLVDEGLLDGERVSPRFDRLYEQFRTLVTSWLHAMVLVHPSMRPEAAMCHHARLAFALFEPYCTAAGEEPMRRLLAGDHDAGILAELAAAPTQAPCLPR